MITRSICNSCFQQYEILIQASDTALVKEITDNLGLVVCPRLCGGKIALLDVGLPPQIGPLRLKAPIRLTGKQLWKAVNGAGLPDELETDPDVVKALLISSKVSRVDVEQHNGNLFIHEIELENGIVLHLSSGLKGAQVLKVTKPRS